MAGLPARLWVHPTDDAYFVAMPHETDGAEYISADSARALADPTGVKLLAEMRSERDELRRENGILRSNAKAQGLVDEIGATGKNRRKTEGKLARTIEGQRAALRKLQGVVERHKTRAEAAEAQLAAAKQRLREARLDQMEARVEAVLRRNFVAPEDAAVEALCLRFGYGAVMDAAARLWARTDMLGAFYVGGCIGFRTEEEARAALDEDERAMGELPYEPRPMTTPQEEK